MKLVFATGNKGKLREAREILGSGFEVLCPADLDIFEDVPENAMTLKENSIIKAETYGRLCGLDCFADDTGLEVDALGGAPGVHAARYAADIARRDGLPVPPDHDFSANIDALLRELDKPFPSSPSPPPPIPTPGAERSIRLVRKSMSIWLAVGMIYFFFMIISF